LAKVINRGIFQQAGSFLVLIYGMEQMTDLFWNIKAEQFKTILSVEKIS